MSLELPIDSKLPYGEDLKTLLKQNEITESYIHKTLRSKGIFFGKTNKEDTVPLLCACLLTPSEYEKIKEHRNEKEDNTKRKSEVLTWSSSNNLLTEAPALNIREICPTEYDNYQFLGDPQFFPVDGNPNKLIYEYEIECYNLMDNWNDKQKTYKGSIQIEVKNGSVDLVATSNHTSKHTDKINGKLLSQLKSELRSKGAISNKEQKISFDFFTNEERIAFFWSLTGSLSDPTLTFNQITDIDIKPDDEKTIPSNLDINWMAKKISRMHLSGDQLHNTFFIQDPNCHPYLVLWKMQASFDFDDHQSKGTCKVNFEFYNYARSKRNTAEFGIDIDSITLDRQYKHLNTSRIKKHLLEKYDQAKIKVFKEISEKKLKAL